MGEEADILRDMIADRDKRMEKIKRKTEEQQGKEIVLSKQLEEVGTQVRTQSSEHEKEKRVLLKDFRKVTEKLDAMQRDFRQQGASLRKYCGPVKSELQNDPSYVMRMQAQLCKAMHSMGINDHQLELVQKQTDGAIKCEKDQIAQATEEKTHRELKLMNELMGLDTEKRDIETEFTAELEKITKECEALEHQIAENEESDEESDSEEGGSDDEQDEEEKEAKEEMMKLLTERREEIERLEREQEEKEEMIAEMEEQLQEMQAAAADMEERRKLDVKVTRTDSGDVDPPTNVEANVNENEDEPSASLPGSGSSEDVVDAIESSGKEVSYDDDEEKKEAPSDMRADNADSVEDQ